jgi:hypothetical protein
MRLRNSPRYTAVVVVTMMTVGIQADASDVIVTDRPYIRHDGGLDATIERCGSDATTPSPGGEGAGNRQQNEPTVAMNPSRPNVLVAGANDYCAFPQFGEDWMGFYVSTDGGHTWINSLNPGYPTDTSPEGRASPIFQRAFGSGDPIMDWDNEDRLFYGGISYNRLSPNQSGFVTPTNGDVIVSTWEYRPEAPLGVDYLRTVIVGTGTPSAFFRGHFNDKPSLRVDDWPSSPYENNVYVAWTLITGAEQGRPQILFSRSADHGVTFSKPLKISKGAGNVLGADIGVAANGSVYVVWRQFADVASGIDNEVVFVTSSDGGQTFSDPRSIALLDPYDRSDHYLDGQQARDCGHGPFLCESGFVFHRVASLPQVVASSASDVLVTWEQISPVAADGDSYRPDGQARVVVSRSMNGGVTWSHPSAVDPQSLGHQWWPNVEFDRSTGTFALIYYDSRSDPSYSPYRPPGNRADGTSACGVPASAVCEVLNTFIATSADGVTWSHARMNTVGHQPAYETFGGLDNPFHGDYLWVDAAGGRIFGVWTDNRDIVPGVDIRDPVDVGFDVWQCRANASSPDTCSNAGGQNQNIYGASIP